MSVKRDYERIDTKRKSDNDSARESRGYIWVISDTHLKNGRNLPVSFVEKVSREDLIIHLGDIISPNVLSFLKSLCAVEAVSGNCDSRNIKDEYPSSRIMRLNGLAVGMTHGRGVGLETIERVRGRFENKVDIALFGHTHSPCNFKSGRTLFFNPGSLTEGRGSPEGYGRLIIDKEPWAEFLEL